MGNYCGLHSKFHDADEACPLCQDDIIKEHPEMGPSIRRQRFWNQMYGAWVTISTLLLILGYLAFKLYREYIIWTR